MANDESYHTPLQLVSTHPLIKFLCLLSQNSMHFFNFVLMSAWLSTYLRNFGLNIFLASMQVQI